MSAPKNVPASMWADEKKHPLLMSILYLIAFFGTLLISHLFASSAHAATVGLHIASVHLPHHDGDKNVNPGLYFRSDAGLVAGVYRNTIGRTSLHVAKAFEGGPFTLTVGVVSGYQRQTHVIPCNQANAYGCTRTTGFSRGAITVMLAPSVRLPALLGVTPRVSLVPGLLMSRSSVVHLSIESEF